jgi:CheY-like chemotaxis protein
MMPVMNGMQFLQAQQRDAAIAGIPVIVLSAANNVEQKISSYPVQGFLRKPITFASLFTIVEQYCDVNSA